MRPGKNQNIKWNAHPRSRMDRVLRTTYIVIYAFQSNTELVLVFQSTGTLVPFGILAESGRNVPPRAYETLHGDQI